MKKTNFLISGLCLLALSAQAFDTSLCPQTPYPVSCKFSQVMSKISGTNFVATKAAETIVQNQIKKNLGGSPDVEITPYSTGDFKAGKFKKLEISIPETKSGPIAFSNFKAETMCDFNHIIIGESDFKFAENFLMKFSLDVTNADVKKIMASPEYIDAVKNLNLQIGGFSLVKIIKPEMKVQDGKLQMSFGLATPLLFGMNIENITVSSKLRAENGKLKLADVSLNNAKYDMKFLLPIINLINPLSFDTKITGNRGIAQIENVDIINDKISLSGQIYVPKNHVIKK